jgi:subtilase family serine protease
MAGWVPRTLTLALVVVVLLVFPPPAHGNPVPLPDAGAPHAYFTVPAPIPGARYVGPLSPSREIGIVVGLQYSHPTLLDYRLAHPGSPLSAAQFTAEFAPSPAEARAVEAYFLHHGATSVQLVGGGDLLWVTLNAGTVPALFGTQLAWYTAGTARYYGTVGTPVLPSAIAPDVTGISGLTDSDLVQFSLAAREVQGYQGIVSPGKTPFQYDTVQGSSTQIFWGTDYQAVYNELPLLQSGFNGTGYAVASLLTSGFNQSANGGAGENLPPFDPAAIKLYYQLSFPTGAAVPTPIGVPVGIGGVTPPPPGPPPNVSGQPLNDDSGAVDENSLDMEMAGSMAPGAALYNFYFPGSLIEQSLSNAASYFDVTLGDALSYNYGSNHLAAITNSWGLTDQVDPVWNGLEKKAAAMNVTLLASSGDQGNAPSSVQSHPQGQWPGFPATATYNSYGVIAVGGTEVTVSGQPMGAPWDPTSSTIPPYGYDAPNITGVTKDVAWYTPSSNPNAFGGTEGGISIYVNEPIWQATSAAQSPIKYSAGQEGTSYARAVPDVALSGYSTIAFSATQTQGQNILVAMGIFDGTSIASPVLAGLLATVSQKVGHPLGFLDNQLYNVSSYFQANPGAQDPFADVTSGANYVFNASTGWDAVTGWGSPNAVLLASDLTNPTYVNYVYDPAGVPGNASGVPPTGGQPPHSPASTTFSIPVLYIVVFVILFALLIAILAVRASRRPKQVPIAPPYPYGPYPPPPQYYGGPPGQPMVAQPQALYVCSYCRRTYPPQWGFCPYCGTNPRQ